MKLAVVRTRDELVELIRLRRDELNISHETIDALGGLSDNYFSKLVCDPPMKGFGEMSLGAVLKALALGIAAVVITEDPAQAKRMASRWKPRKRTPMRRGRAASTATIECVAGDDTAMQSQLKIDLAGDTIDDEKSERPADRGPGSRTALCRD
jgi:hypothetical protein